MPDITLFEFHSHGNVRVGPSKLPGIGSDDEHETEEFATTDEFESSEDDGGVPVSPVAVLIALGLLVGLAAVAKKLLGGDDEHEEVVPLEESDDMTAPADD